MTVELLTKAISGNMRALGRLMSEIEADERSVGHLGEEIRQAGKGGRVVGVTGPPGAGKSTLIDQLIAHLRQRGERVGVVAVDPSSPFSGGALLGDRIRMVRHSADDGVFIRSLGSRGAHGGLTQSAAGTVACLDAAGFGWIIVETVGVGQTELDIGTLADVTVVLLVPEAGDAIQTMKAGLLEIADLIVVNKADRPGAAELVTALRAERSVPILLVSAAKGEGIEPLLHAIEKVPLKGTAKPI